MQLRQVHTIALLVACLLGTAPSSGQTPAAGTSATFRAGGGVAAEEAPYWIENAELDAVRQPPADGAAPAPPGQAHPAGEAPSTHGEVFDSADYQLLLLIGPSWEEALVLSLGTGDVRAFPTTEVIGRDGNPRRVDPAAGRPVAGFMSHADGRITFATTDHDYAIEPVPRLVGEIPLGVLYERQPVYERRARGYAPDPAAVAKLAGIDRDVEIVAFFGTWCQICKKHLPALLSTIDHAGNPRLKLTLIAVSEDGAEPADWISEYGAGNATPTFVVRIDQMEIGRIEEEPNVNVETDLVELLSEALQR